MIIKIPRYPYDNRSSSNCVVTKGSYTDLSLKVAVLAFCSYMTAVLWIDRKKGSFISYENNRLKRFPIRQTTVCIIRPEEKI